MCNNNVHADNNDDVPNNAQDAKTLAESLHN